MQMFSGDKVRSSLDDTLHHWIGAINERQWRCINDTSSSTLYLWYLLNISALFVTHWGHSRSGHAFSKDMNYHGVTHRFSHSWPPLLVNVRGSNWGRFIQTSLLALSAALQCVGFRVPLWIRRDVWRLLTRAASNNVSEVGSRRTLRKKLFGSRLSSQMIFFYKIKADEKLC